MGGEAGRRWPRARQGMARANGCKHWSRSRRVPQPIRAPRLERRLQRCSHSCSHSMAAPARSRAGWIAPPDCHACCGCRTADAPCLHAAARTPRRPSGDVPHRLPDGEEAELWAAPDHRAQRRSALLLAWRRCSEQRSGHCARDWDWQPDLGSRVLPFAWQAGAVREPLPGRVGHPQPWSQLPANLAGPLSPHPCVLSPQ